MKNIKKVWLNTLSFLDNSIINSIIVIILVLYSSGIFENINNFIGQIYNFAIIRLIILLLIIYLAPKDITIAILLAVSYLVSINHINNSEHFYSGGKYVKTLPYHPKVIPEHENHESFKDGSHSVSTHSMPSMDRNEMFLKNNTRLNRKRMTENFLDKIDNEQSTNNSSDEEKNNYEIDNSLPKSACMEMYDPKFESINDICSPTATFKNELNAQGLNYPEGFNSPYVGSPL